MTPDEAGQVLAMVVGYWPHPELTDEETSAWQVELLPRGFELGALTVRSMAQSGREFRPGAGRFASEFDARRRHETLGEEPPKQIEGPGLSPSEGLSLARDALAQAKGELCPS